MLTTVVHAQSAREFYNSRQMTMIIGTPPGGGYDAFGRLIARHMGKHLPGGTAKFIVKNMPGGAGIIAANHIFNVADRDGTTIGIVNREAILDKLFTPKQSQAKFDPREFVWLGSPNLEVGVLYVSTASQIASIDDARQKEVTLAASGGANTVGVLLPNILNSLLGTRFKVIAGYPGSMDAILAVEKGEVDGRYSPGFAGPEAAKVMEMVNSGRFRFIGYLSPQTSSEFPNVPSVVDYAKSDEDKRLLTVLLAPQGLGRPFFAPPGLPADRAQALQDAFAATLKDREFLEEANRQGFVITATLGHEMASYIQNIYATPPEILNKATSMLAPSQ